MTVKEQALRNYGRTWTLEMIQNLVTRGKLTEADFKEITGQDFVAPTDSEGKPLVTLEGLKAENERLKAQLADAQTDNLMALEAIATLYEMITLV